MKAKLAQRNLRVRLEWCQNSSRRMRYSNIARYITRTTEDAP